MRHLPLSLVVSVYLAGSLTLAQAAGLTDSKSHFVYQEGSGKVMSARIVPGYWPKQIVHPFGHVDLRLDPKLMRAATIAEERANAHSHSRCWHYVKNALLAAGVLNSYPKTAYAIDAGRELVRNYGFLRLAVRDPYAAPIGAVLVYGTKRGGGHVEIRTRDGFVSDFHSKRCCPYRLVAVYAKFAS